MHDSRGGSIRRGDLYGAVNRVNFNAALAGSTDDAMGRSDNVVVRWTCSQEGVGELLDTSGVLVELAARVLESAQCYGALWVCLRGIEEDGHEDLNAAHFPGGTPVAL